MRNEGLLNNIAGAQAPTSQIQMITTNAVRDAD